MERKHEYIHVIILVIITKIIPIFFRKILEFWK